MTAVNSVTPTIQADVSLLYIAFFGRAPDAAGFSYWTREFAANPTTQTAAGAAAYAQNVAALQMAANPEFTNTYGGLTPEQAVNTFYRNILNRDADAAGLAYWVGEIEDGVPFATVAWNIVYAASLGGPNVDPADALLVNNKVEVAEYFAMTLASNDLNAANSAFSTVTSDPATVASAESALLIATANQITLTPIAETLIGASGNNTFNAMGFVNSSGTVIQTLQNGDTLIGSVNGVNTLNANLISSGAITPNALTNIQQIVLTNVAGTGFGLTNANAVQSVTLNALATDLAISDAQSADIAFTINNTTGSKVVGIALDEDVDTDADIANITVRNSTIKLDLDAQYEELNLAVISTSTVGSDFAGAITVSGAGNLTLAGSGATTISSTDISTTSLTGTFATAFGATDTTFVGGNGNTTLTNGGGENSITFGNGTNTLTTVLANLNDDVVAGGTGLNTLTLSAQTVDIGGTSAETALANVTNFDVLQLSSAATNSVTISTNFVDAGFTTITGGTNNDLVVASNVALTDLTFNGGLGSDTFTFNNTASGTITVNQVETVNSGSAAGVASQTVNIANGTGSVSVTLGAGSDTVNILDNNTVTVTVNGVETINTGASVTGNTVILANDSTVLTINGGSGDLTVDAATNIASGTAANTYAFGDGENTLQIQAFATVSNAASVVGGAGDDTLALTAGIDSNADGVFAKISEFETLALSSSGTNNITIGTNFGAAGFTTITGGTDNDTVGANNTTVSSLTFNGGLGSDTFTFNTSSGTITVNQVELVNSTGAGAQIVNIANGTGSVSVALGAGNDIVNILDNNTVTVTVTGVETINTFASVTGNTVILGDNATAVTINGGEGDLTVNANAVSTAAISVFFGDAENTLQIATFATVSNAATVVGGAGDDTLALTAEVASNADGVFAKISEFETLALSSSGTNNITIGTNFVAAGFTAVTGGTNFDTVTASNVTLDGFTFTGGAGTGDTLVLATAGGTVTINGVETVTSSGSANTVLSVANGASVASLVADLGAGTDSLVNLNTAGLTVTLTGAESYFGSVGVDTVTLGSGTAISISGGGGTDAVTLSVNTSNVTVLAGGATMGVIGNLAATADALAIVGAGTYNLTSVETVTVTGAEVSRVNGFLFLTDATSGVTAGDNTLFTYTLSDNDIAGFTMINETAGVTGGSVLLTVDAAENATITFNNSALIAGQTGASIISTMDVGYTSITLGGTSSDVIQTNLGGLSAGVSTADSFVVTNFGSASTADSVDLTLATLQNGLGVNTVLKSSFLTTAGIQNADVFTLNTTFITGNSTTLANLSATSPQNQQGLIFQFGLGSTTANLTTQAGIDAAVAYIVGNIGTTTSGTQSAVFVVDGGPADTNNALFLFQDDGVSGIDASDLKLIGVVSGTMSASTFS